jgi:SAM-dependent methyltransferase
VSKRASRYLDVRYSEERAPRGAYPEALCAWVLENVYGTTGRLLDLGCGRGDHLTAFERLGFDVVGADASTPPPELARRHAIRTVDLDSEPLPFPEDEFDFVFAKSIVEHLDDPIRVLAETLRVLRPGGVIVVMTPSWEHMHWGPFYADPTHVSPFTAPALRDALALAGFAKPSVQNFRQLPLLWRHPSFTPVAQVLAALPLPYRPYRERAPWPDGLNKAIRFSKEVMLLGTAGKPAADDESRER